MFSIHEKRKQISSLLPDNTWDHKITVIINYIYKLLNPPCEHYFTRKVHSKIFGAVMKCDSKHSCYFSENNVLFWFYVSNFLYNASCEICYLDIIYYDKYLIEAYIENCEWNDLTTLSHHLAIQFIVYHRIWFQLRACAVSKEDVEFVLIYERCMVCRVTVNQSFYFQITCLTYIKWRSYKYCTIYSKII